MADYWGKRAAKTQNALTAQSVKDTEKQLIKYYGSAMRKTIGQFEKTYNKLLLSIEEGREPTPADLYKLDTYWSMQAQLREELTKLGDKQIVLLSKEFEKQFFDIYNSFSLPSTQAFNTINSSGATQLINEIWCADGKSWSTRVWNNTSKLQQALNDNLIHCVVTGKKTTELKEILQNEFGASYSRADTLVRTEMAHIQTVAAKRRYKDYGLEYYEILGNEDNTCGGEEVNCHKLHGKKFLLNEMKTGENAPPFHPNCKCCIAPVVELTTQSSFLKGQDIKETT